MNTYTHSEPVNIEVIENILHKYVIFLYIPRLWSIIQDLSDVRHFCFFNDANILANK